MRLKTLRFLSLFCTALVMGAALAHLLELPNKIDLARGDYFTVQQLYRGWAFLGIPVAAALLSTLALTIMVRHTPRVFPLTLTALLCLVGAQIVFWTFTYPANQATNNWTFLPADWQLLRQHWEYSHAVGAGLDMLALATLILSVLVQQDVQQSHHTSYSHSVTQETELRTGHELQ
jgi:hypothetical protein